MTAVLNLERRLAELREAFDRGFAAPPSQGGESTVDVLAIRVAGIAYALRVRELSALVKARRIVPLPTRRHDLLGGTGLRGGLILVFGLASLLGHVEDPAAIRWLAVCGAPGFDPIALGFAGLDGLVRLHATDVQVAGPSDARATARASPTIAQMEGVPRPVIDVPFLLESLKTPTGTAGPTEER